ncbi:MAG: transcriptional regulator [Gammaproteobacteria bacterium]|nr:transcriptional regulator [Gammaproteobacteria bacterium]
MSKAVADEILDLVREAGLVRPRDLKSAGVSGGALSQLARRGLLERVGRGLYAVPGTAPSEHRSLAEVSKRTPRGVICLLSALSFHGLTTQTPPDVWLAIGPKDRAPRPAGVRLRVVRVSGESRHAGVETRVVESVPVRIYGVAKTVADCFKFRNKIGTDIAVEALRDCLEQRRCTADELTEYARVCRVSRVMRPYMEALA